MIVWIFQTGEPLHVDACNPRPMRAMNLANELVKAGHKVVLWSSNFHHQEKRHRAIGGCSYFLSELLEIKLVDSPGYSRNISFKRLWDHAVLAKNLYKMLAVETNIPDVAFVGYPPIEAAVVMTQWLTRRKVPFVLDVKDQWPEFFLTGLSPFMKFIGRITLAPYFYLGRRAIKQATSLSSMALSFLQWALSFADRKENKMDLIIPLTSPTDQVSSFDIQLAGHWWDKQGIKSDNVFKVCFVGSHSRAFDIEPVYEAAKELEFLGISCKFILCGNGEESSVWKQKMAGMSNVLFPGWVDRAQIEALALRSHAALAPYKNIDNFMMNIPNKVIDSLALGLPILSPLHGEVRELIIKNGVGLSYGDVVGKTLRSCIQELIEKPEFQRKISESSQRLFKEKFSYQKVYGDLVEHLELIATKGN